MVAKYGDSRAIVSDNFGILLSKAGGSEEESAEDNREEFFHTGCVEDTTIQASPIERGSFLLHLR